MADVVKEEPVDFDSNWTEDATQIDSSKCDKLPPNEHNNSDEEDVKKDSKFYQVCLTEHWNAGEGTSKQNDGLASTSSTKVKEEKDSENSEMEEDESKSLFEEELHNVEQSMTVEEGDERLMDEYDETEGSQHLPKCNCDLGTNWHLKPHVCNNFTRYRCKKCDFTSIFEFALKTHMNDKHPEEICNKQCLYCDFVCSTYLKLQQHVKIEHNETKCLQCEYCDYRATKNYNLRVHVKRTHHNEPMNFKCESCDYATFTKSILKRHVDAIHLKTKNSTERIKSNECDSCSYAAFTKQELRRHMERVHEKVKRFKCELCDYRASTNSNLKLHVYRMHQNKEKPHKCHSCHFSSFFQQDLLRHLEDRHQSA